MATKPVKIKQGNRYILLEFVIQSNRIELKDSQLVSLTQKILKKWLFNVNRGREALTILLEEDKALESSTIYDILNIIYQNNAYLGRSFLEYSIKNFKIAIKIIFEGEKIDEFENEVIDLNSHNSEAGINKIWFDKKENKYIMIIKTDTGCEVISTIESDFEDLSSEYNISMKLLVNIVKNAVSSNVDISDKNFQLTLIKTYNQVVHKPTLTLASSGK